MAPTTSFVAQTVKPGMKDILETTLPNGLHVILKENHSAPVVAMQVWVGVGSNDEKPDQAGMAHVLEHMLFKGTQKRGVGEIARDVEGAGGDINAWTSFEETVFHIVMAKDFAEQGLDILSDAVFHAALDETELTAELEVIVEEIKRGEDNPAQKLSEDLFGMSFDQFPYKNPIIGSKESVRSFTRDGVMAFYKGWYIPQNMTVVLSGAFKNEEMLSLVRKHFGEEPAGLMPDRLSVEEPAQVALRVRQKQDAVQQSYVALGVQIGGIQDEDLPALDVAATVLGQGDSSRLVRLLKRERGLANEVHTYPYAGKEKGLFIIEAELPTQTTREALALILDELYRLANEEITKAELTKAVSMMENEVIYQTQTVQGQARRLGYFHGLTGDCGFHEEYLDRIHAVTVADVLDVAKRYFTPDTLNVALLSREDKPPLFADEDLAGLVRDRAERAARKHEALAKPDEHGIVRVTLENGIRLLVQENRNVPLVSFQAAIPAGLRLENEENNGVSNLISRMLTLGAGRYDALDIAQQADSLGATLNGFSGRNTIGLKAQVVSKNLDKLFDLFSECLLDPSFDKVELEREKTLVLEEIQNKRDIPSQVAFELFNKTLYKHHPFRMDVLGTPESVKRFVRSDLEEFYKKNLVPERLVIAVSGDVSAARMVRMVERNFGRLKPFEREYLLPEPENAPKRERRETLELDKQQAHLVMGFLGTTFEDKDRFALGVMMTVLGGMSGRLFTELRDKQSLAYSVFGFHMEALDPGFLAIYIGTSPEKLLQAERGIREQLTRLRDELVPDEELERVRRYLIGTQAIGLQRNASLAGNLLFNELYGLGYDEHLRYAEAIRNVTAQDVQRMAQRYLRLDAPVVVTVRPPASADEQTNSTKTVSQR